MPPVCPFLYIGPLSSLCQLLLYNTNVRLTNLVPELLEFVDEGRIKMRPAVELSYLDEDSQRDVVDEIDMNDIVNIS